MNATGVIKAIVFDWGDTLMRGLPEFQGAMVHWPRVEVVPSVAEALEQLYGRFICCVASNAEDSDAELMGQALARVGIRQYFHYLFTSKELGAAKPEPEFFSEILRRLDVEPEECVMVGNDYVTDIVPAKAVGMRTILFLEIPVAGVVPSADVIINSMRHLPAAVADVDGWRIA